MKCVTNAGASNSLFSGGIPQLDTKATHFDSRRSRRARGNYQPSRSKRDERHWAKPNLSLDLGDELIIDNFAGGGGTSEGLEQAFGRPVDIAINHDPAAICLHAINHPWTKHYCESVWDIDPIKVTGNRPVGLVWLSPDCRHFSKAKGGTPVEKHIRGLAWIALRWVAKCKPRVVLLENVVEMTSWSKLIRKEDGKQYPDPKHKGKTFQSYIRQLRAHGYTVEWRELRASDHDTPTIRKRLFLVARRDGRPIVWPDATHGAPDSPAVKQGLLRPWRAAAECIDFSIAATSMFERERPLAENTLRRVAKGTWRHVLANPSPFIVPQDTGARVGDLVAPMIAPLRGTQEAHLQGDSARSPVSTISAGGTHHALSSAHLVRLELDPRSGRELNVPALRANPHTDISHQRRSVVAAHLTHLTHHGHRPGTRPDAPLPTVTGANRGEQVIVAACLEQANGGFYEGNGRSLDAPLSTLMGSGSQQRLVAAHLIKYYGEGGQWASAADPMHTLTTKDRVGLVETVQIRQDSLPANMLAKAKRCARYFHKYLPEQFPVKCGLIIVDGWVLVDITLRMLVPRELYLAQGFPADYVIDEIPDPKLLFVNGEQVPGDPRLIPRIPLTKTDQVRMCGNSVCPPVAKALIEANFTHERHIAERLAA
ncbi:MULTISPECIES: DNA cytosine methyltransferase [Achromobacter]|uniref:DNA (cytosine-5-)-methyltransferase n=1 Tax=Achromobacter xylosoxidans (strain A8) TaxID=762376 RepID=E3HYB0_ACHXA|nr:DNA cytosine methyltransferase [Achromobacter xylosoxidans]ADP20064.1 C-5 cytosine-specific DNA methylase 2 [Achromobacter xylosoxidans A8]